MNRQSFRAWAFAAVFGSLAIGGAQCKGAACSRRFGAGGTPRGGSGASASRCPGPKARCKYLKAVCYEGYRDLQAPGGSEPTCEQVAADLTRIAPFTRGIRTYGSRSTQHDGKCIPTLTDRLGLDLHVGVWVDGSLSDAQNFAAIDESIAVMQGHSSVKTLIVGNEYMLRARKAFRDRDAAEKSLVRYVRYARTKAPPQIAVVTAEADIEWLEVSPALFDAVDFVLWQAHPWWAGIDISRAAAAVATTHDRLLALMKKYGVAKREVLGETGWPWSIGNGAAVGSEANQAQYLRDINRYSATVGLEFWVFEAFDESWKNEEGPVGGAWGLWPANRNMPGRQVIAGLPIPPTRASIIPSADMWP
jgi:exo-beta-1,3-glucanase (GH17 family)